MAKGYCVKSHDTNIDRFGMSNGSYSQRPTVAYIQREVSPEEMGAYKMKLASRKSWLTSQMTAHNNAVQHCQVLILMLINDTAGFAIFDALTELRKDKKIYRHEVKRKASMISQSYAKYEARVKSNMSGPEVYDLFYDCCDEFHEYYDKHVRTLRMQISRTLLRLGEADYELKSYIVCALSVIEFSRMVFDSYFRALEAQYHFNLKREFEDWDLADLHKQTRELCMALISREAFQELNKDKDIELALKIMSEKLNVTNYDNIVGEVLKKHRATVDKYFSHDNEAYEEWKKEFADEEDEQSDTCGHSAVV